MGKHRYSELSSPPPRQGHHLGSRSKTGKIQATRSGILKLSRTKKVEEFDMISMVFSSFCMFLDAFRHVFRHFLAILAWFRHALQVL